MIKNAVEQSDIAIINGSDISGEMIANTTGSIEDKNAEVHLVS